MHGHEEDLHTRSGTNPREIYVIGTEARGLEPTHLSDIGIGATEFGCFP